MADLQIHTWRFLDTGARPGEFNMALDLSLMEGLIQEPDAALPCLRVYAWEPPCVSLGHHQKPREEDSIRWRGAGYDVVRRPTGGRAVLHWRELTYSIVVPEGIFGRPTSVIESYRILSQGLIAALGGLGIEAGLAPGAKESTLVGSVACFASAARCDLVSGGKKIVGSAQLRRQGIILQHGSVPLVDRGEDEARVLLGDNAEPIAGMTSLSAAAGRPIGYGQAAAAVREGFAQAFGVEFVAATIEGPQ